MAKKRAPGTRDSAVRRARARLARRQRLAFASVAACLGVAQAQTLPTGFALQDVVLEPFATNPVGFAFLPDGRILVIEKDSGNVRLAASGAGTSAVIATIQGVTAGDERGLLGVAVDPTWPARPYVYFHFTHTDSTVHVTMYTASGDLALPGSTNMTLASPYLLFKGIGDVYTHHNGGTLRFGPDGCLYVSAGDDGIACEAQDIDRPNGKILRLFVANMPGTGSGPPPLGDITPADNPFFGSTDNARLVYAYGLRNPFRFTVDFPTGNLYIGDVGLLAWEEVDELVALGYTGNNYGWPALEGFVPPPCCTECASHPPFTDPVHVYANPTDPDLSAVVIAGPRYRRAPDAPSSFPFEYVGDVFIAEFYAGWIRRLKRTGDAWDIAPAVPGQPDAGSWANGIPYITDFQLGPDGALYFVNMIGIALPRGVHRIVDLGSTDTAAAVVGAGIRTVPNPGRAGAGLSIRYHLAAAVLEVRVYDASGRLVRTLRPASGAANALHWDGRDDRGREAAPGLYLLRLTLAHGKPLHGKITLVD